MADIERLQQWMKENGYTMKSLARHMGIKYITLWAMMDRQRPSDRFITLFIQHFGCDKAVVVFHDLLSPKQ
jgi:transcriptional regulator with XRE-family HTH domain